MPRFKIRAIETTVLRITIDQEGVDTAEQALQYARLRCGELDWDQAHLGVENYEIDAEE